MKKISLLFLALVLASQTCFAADNTKRFEITITDFFFPLLSAEQNQMMRAQLFDDKLTIAGAYIAKSRIKNLNYTSLEKDVGYPCFWNCVPLSHSTKTSRDHIIRRQQAKIIAINPQEHKVIFELPADIENRFLLDTIYFAFPLEKLLAQPDIPKSGHAIDKKYMEVHLPVTLNTKQAHFNHYKLEPRLTFASSSPPYSARIDLEGKRDFEASLGVAVQIYMLDENNTPLPAPLLPDFKMKLPIEKSTGTIGDVDSIRFFGPTNSATYTNNELSTLNHSISFDHSGFSEQNLTPIKLTEKTPVWHLMQNTKGELINLGHVKIIRLQGELPYELGEGEYKSQKHYRTQETWIQTGNQVVQVHGRPDENWSTADHCHFSYNINFAPNGDKQLYFLRGNNSHVFFTPLENNDMAPLLDFETRKKEMMFKMPSAIKTCLQKTDHTKRLFNKTNAELNRDFAIYKKAIENAQ